MGEDIIASNSTSLPSMNAEYLDPTSPILFLFIAMILGSVVKEILKVNLSTSFPFVLEIADDQSSGNQEQNWNPTSIFSWPYLRRNCSWIDPLSVVKLRKQEVICVHKCQGCWH